MINYLIRLSMRSFFSLAFVSLTAIFGAHSEGLRLEPDETVGSAKDTFSNDLGSGPMIPFDPSFVTNPKHFLSKIPVVVWANIADGGSGPLAQRAVIYVNGVEKTRTKISSGKAGHSSVTGYFYGDSVERRHYSRKYGAWMPFAVFFYEGYATHQAPVGTEPELGERASHGCLRMPELVAKFIFDQANHFGRVPIPQFTRRGLAMGNETSKEWGVAVVVEKRNEAKF